MSAMGVLADRVRQAATAVHTEHWTRHRHLRKSNDQTSSHCRWRASRTCCRACPFDHRPSLHPRRKDGHARGRADSVGICQAGALRRVGQGCHRRHGQRIQNRPDIAIKTGTTVDRFSGSPGNFAATLSDGSPSRTSAPRFWRRVSRISTRSTSRNGASARSRTS